VFDGPWNNFGSVSQILVSFTTSRSSMDSLSFILLAFDGSKCILIVWSPPPNKGFKEDPLEVNFLSPFIVILFLFVLLILVFVSVAAALRDVTFCGAVRFCVGSRERSSIRRHGTLLANSFLNFSLNIP
jgi:hypothetical protein